MRTIAIMICDRSKSKDGSSGLLNVNNQNAMVFLFATQLICQIVSYQVAILLPNFISTGRWLLQFLSLLQLKYQLSVMPLVVGWIRKICEYRPLKIYTLLNIFHIIYAKEDWCWGKHKAKSHKIWVLFHNSFISPLYRFIVSGKSA